MDAAHDTHFWCHANGRPFDAAAAQALADVCQKCPAEWRGGQRFTTVVTSTSGRYVLIRYHNPNLAGRDHDQF